MIRFIDYETTSYADLPAVGSHNYVEHPSTRILMAGTALEGEEPYITPNLKSCKQDGEVFASWGGFDRLVALKLEKIPASWIDVSALALYCGLPRSLKEFCKAVGIPATKDARGTRLINIYSRDPSKVLEGDDLAAFEEYCLQDVRLLLQAWKVLGPLYPEWKQTQEKNYWHIEAMNTKGVPIDTEAVAEATSQIRAQEARLVAECVELTEGVTPTQTEKIRQFLGLEDVQRATLAGAKFDDPVKARVAQIRLQISNATAKKLQPMLDFAGPTGRARGCFTNNGAHTGRGSSQGIQFQNLRRSSPDQDYFAALHARTPTADPLGDAQKNIRGFIRPEPGKKFVVADYSQVEVRVLAWLSGDTNLLDLFKSTEDPYKTFASIAFQTPPDKITPTERQYGKIAVLGCFSHDTLVLTDRGWLPILSVSRSDRVWDGEEWVCHGGVVDRGVREVLSGRGVTATPEHLFWAEGEWEEWRDVCENPRLFRSVLSSASLPSSSGSRYETSENPVVGTHGVDALAETSLWCSEGILLSDDQLAVMFAPKERPPLPRPRCTSGTPPSVQTPFYGFGFSPESLLASVDVTTRATPTTLLTGDEESRYTSLGAGETQERGASLQTRLRDELPFLPTYLPSPATTGKSCISTESTIRVATSRGTSVLCRSERTTRTDEPFKPLKKRTRVFDVSLAGPRSRFTILTDEGPALVHNSGYGVGGPGLAQQAVGYGVKLTDKQGWELVKKYRDAFPAVPQLWNDLDTGLRNLVTGSIGELEVGRCVFTVNKPGTVLKCVLPSGRPLRYMFPKLEKHGDRTGVVFTSRFGRKMLWSGHVVENLCQAVATDLKLEALREFGGEAVLEVHDEIVLEVPEDKAEKRLASLIEIMESPGPWFDQKGLIKAEGKVMERYGK